MAGLGWLDSDAVCWIAIDWLRIDGGLGLVRLMTSMMIAKQQLRIDGGLGLVRLPRDDHPRSLGVAD